jgi:hypothetical protein
MRRTRISCETLVALVAFMRLSLRNGAHPGFPVKSIGVDALHAAFLNESRTRGPLFGPRTGNPGTRHPSGAAWYEIRISSSISPVTVVLIARGPLKKCSRVNVLASWAIGLRS